MKVPDSSLTGLPYASSVLSYVGNAPAGGDPEALPGGRTRASRYHACDLPDPVDAAGDSTNLGGIGKVEMTDEDTQLRLVRNVPLPVDRVWNLWTLPDGLQQWWWPVRFGTDYSLDLTVGGKYSFSTEDVPGVGILNLTGTFQRVNPPHILTYSWSWAGDTPGESLVQVQFDGLDPDSTRVDVFHQGLANQEERDHHVVGWNDCLDRLELLSRSR